MDTIIVAEAIKERDIEQTAYITNEGILIFTDGFSFLPLKVM